MRTARAVRRARLPRHVDGRHRRGDGRAERVALLADRVEAGAPRADARAGAAAFHAALDEVPDERAASSAIREALRGHLASSAGSSTWPRSSYANGATWRGRARTAFVAERRRYEERWRALFREGVERGELRVDLDAEAATLLVLSAANWAYTWLRPAADTDELADRFTAILVDGVRGYATPRNRASPSPWGRLLIVNPLASGVTEEPSRSGQAALRPRSTATTHTEKRARLARARESEVDAIYVFGGDGTFNEVLNGVSRDVPLGFVPGGGTSVLPRALGLPRDPVAAARGSPRAVPAASGSAARTGGASGSTRASGSTPSSCGPDRLGRSGDGRRPGDTAFARARSGWSRRARPLRAGARGGRGRSRRVRARRELRPLHVPRSPRARRGSRGALRQRTRPRRAARSSARAPPLRLAGWRGARPWRVLVVHDADRLVIRCDEPMPLQVDGEDLGDVETVVLEAERNAVTVLCCVLDTWRRPRLRVPPVA